MQSDFAVITMVRDDDFDRALRVIRDNQIDRGL